MGAATFAVERLMNLLSINDQPQRYPPSFYASNIKPLENCAVATGELHSDICVIGGGFTGLSTALHTAHRGYSVRVLEAQRVGFGASGRNGGQVGQGQRLDQDELEQMFGDSRAMDLWKIGSAAPALVRELAASDLVHTDFGLEKGERGETYQGGD